MNTRSLIPTISSNGVEVYLSCTSSGVSATHQFRWRCIVLSFTDFRAHLNNSGYGVTEAVESEIQLHDNGWTTKSLASLFEDDFEPCSVTRLEKCKLCHRPSKPLVLWWDYRWQQRVRRIKYGIDLKARMSKKEKRCMQSWKRALEQHRAGICWLCYKKNYKLALEMSEKEIWNIYSCTQTPSRW